MKFATIALIAVVSAQEEETFATQGAACGADGDDECAETEECAVATETTSFCQDCTAESRSYEDESTFVCADDEATGSMTLAASTMALLAAAAMMA